jgi:hypothetical protein
MRVSMPLDPTPRSDGHIPWLAEVHCDYLKVFVQSAAEASATHSCYNTVRTQRTGGYARLHSHRSLIIAVLSSPVQLLVGA